MCFDANNQQIGKISLKELLSKRVCFKIPEYQRGYRWGEKQVTTLIRDLSSKKISNTNQYCLQTIVLQKAENNSFLIVDGQQRLTTIHLLFDKQNYISISQEDQNNVTSNNSDNLSDIHKKITSFIAKKNDTNIQYITNNNMPNIYFIWYLLSDKEDGNQVFQRLNSGKIPLTNSELIRSLFFSSSIDLVFQTEIAAEWEQIETRLRDDRFWFMFNSQKTETFTRIDRLWEIVFGVENKDDRYAAYLEMEETIEEDNLNKEKEYLESNWKKILNLYWFLEKCFNNVELYHYIGWIRFFTNTQFKTIYELYLSSNQNFKENLKKIIANKASEIVIANNKKNISANIQNIHGLDLDNWKAYSYATPKAILRSFFVLLNIETLNKRQSNFPNSEIIERFPFGLYADIHSEGWNIEHISSHTTNPMTDPKEQVEWAIEVFSDLPEENPRKNEILSWLKKNVTPELENYIDKIGLTEEYKSIQNHSQYNSKNEGYKDKTFADIYSNYYPKDLLIKDELEKTPLLI